MNCRYAISNEYGYSDLTFTGIIYGYSGSTAQEYAEKCGYNFESIGDAPETRFGDVNGDGIINPVDASKILVKFAELSAPDANQPSSNIIAKYDINGDSLITAVDASLLLAFCADLAKDADLTLEAFLERK